MSDEANDLRATLERLHDQLRAATDVTGETRQMLQGTVADIHALLNTQTGAPRPSSSLPGQAGQESIVGRLTTAEREFEATHPTLAGIVGSVIDALGQMGI